MDVKINNTIPLKVLQSIILNLQKQQEAEMGELGDGQKTAIVFNSSPGLSQKYFVLMFLLVFAFAVFGLMVINVLCRKMGSKPHCLT